MKSIQEALAKVQVYLSDKTLTNTLSSKIVTDKAVIAKRKVDHVKQSEQYLNLTRSSKFNHPQ